MTPDEARLLAKRIASGHAWREHRSEFLGVADADEFAATVAANLSTPDAERPLLRGRTAYWDDQSGTIVIVSPNDPDGGTAFHPIPGREYFETLP